MAKDKGRKRKSEKLRQKALKQLRKTRAKINADHPDLLSSMRARLDAAPQARVKQEQPQLEAGEVKVSREKNLKAIMQFLSIADQSKDFEMKLKKMLMETEKGTKH